MIGTRKTRRETAATFRDVGKWRNVINSLYLQFLHIRDEKAALAAAQEKIKLINQILGEKEDVNQW